LRRAPWRARLPLVSTSLIEEQNMKHLMRVALVLYVMAILWLCVSHPAVGGLLAVATLFAGESIRRAP
jgi:hypothetical protein